MRPIKQKKPPAIMEDKDIYKTPAKKHRRGPVLLFKNYKGCAVYIAASKRLSNTKYLRKPLIYLLINTVKKPCDNKN